MLLKRFKERACKAEIALHELLGILRTVDARQIEYEVRTPAIFVKERGVCVDIVLEDLTDGQRGSRSVLAVADACKGGHQVLPYEAAGSRYQNIHAFFSSS